MRTEKNILYSTFIGLEVSVSKSSDRKMQGIGGKIVDETKNLIVIERKDGKTVKVPKASSEFLMVLDNGKKFRVEGKKIAFRPHERPKKVAKRM